MVFPVLAYALAGLLALLKLVYGKKLDTTEAGTVYRKTALAVHTMFNFLNWHWMMTLTYAKRYKCMQNDKMMPTTMRT